MSKFVGRERWKAHIAECRKVLKATAPKDEAEPQVVVVREDGEVRDMPRGCVETYRKGQQLAATGTDLVGRLPYANG